MESQDISSAFVDKVELVEVDLADSLRPARGIIIGACLGMPIFAAVIVAAWWLL